MRMLRKRCAVLSAMAFAILWSSTIGAAGKGRCETKILHLGQDVERVAWSIPGMYFGNFIGTVIYPDDRTEQVQGNRHGFCALDPNHKSGSGNWLTAEERGITTNLFNLRPKDTTRNEWPDPASDISILRYLMGRTNRYDHDVFGRGYHLTRLVALLNNTGSQHWIDLPPDRVFMARYAHMFIMNERGAHNSRFGYALIEGQIEHGPAVSVYGYLEGRLQLLARTPWHGKKNGWINFVAAGDFDRDGCAEVVVVRDPQEHGTLELWELRHEASSLGTPFTLELMASAEGFSNHVFGTLSNRISVVADVNFDGIRDFVLPDHSRKTLRVMSPADGGLTEIHRVELPSPVAHDMTYDWPFSYRPRPGYTLVVPLEDNTIRLVHLPKWKQQRLKPPHECAGAYRRNSSQ